MISCYARSPYKRQLCGRSGLLQLRLLLTQHPFAVAAFQVLPRGAVFEAVVRECLFCPEPKLLYCKMVAPSRRVMKLWFGFLLQRLTLRGSRPLQKMSRQQRQNGCLLPCVQLHLQFSHSQMSLRKGSSDVEITVTR